MLRESARSSASGSSLYKQKQLKGQMKMTDLAQDRTGQPDPSAGQDRPRSADQELRARARAVIPGGMYGHQNAGPLPPEYPQFMRSGRGARIWDVDGNEYVDLMNSYGPVVLGHRHPAVERSEEHTS